MAAIADVGLLSTLNYNELTCKNTVYPSINNYKYK